MGSEGGDSHTQAATASVASPEPSVMCPTAMPGEKGAVAGAQACGYRHGCPGDDIAVDLETINAVIVIDTLRLWMQVDILRDTDRDRGRYKVLL